MHMPMFTHRDHASVGDVADDVFELDRRVVDVETFSENILDLNDDRIGLGHRYVRNRNMT